MASTTLFGLFLLMISCANAKPQGFGLGSNLALGPLGNFGSGFNFQPGNKFGQTSTTASPNGLGQQSNGVGLQSNLGLGPLGSIGSGFNFGGPGSSTAAPAPASGASNAPNPIGISSNLGLGQAGSLGSGFNFQPPPTTAKPLGLESGSMPMMLNASTDDSAVNGSVVETTATPELTTTTTVTPTWTEWSNWTTCSTTCGLGHEKRTRTCTGGTTCIGLAEMQRRCFGSPCRSIGVWSEWSNATTCSANCGVGSQTLTRTCMNGTCFGPAEMRQTCNLMPCPVGEWSEWSEWSTCSVTCGFGRMKRTRVCNGGICHGLAEMQMPCHLEICDLNIH